MRAPYCCRSRTPTARAAAGSVRRSPRSATATATASWTWSSAPPVTTDRRSGPGTRLRADEHRPRRCVRRLWRAAPEAAGEAARIPAGSNPPVTNPPDNTVKGRAVRRLRLGVSKRKLYAYEILKFTGDSAREGERGHLSVPPEDRASAPQAERRPFPDLRRRGHQQKRKLQPSRAGPPQLCRPGPRDTEPDVRRRDLETTPRRRALVRKGAPVRAVECSRKAVEIDQNALIWRPCFGTLALPGRPRRGPKI